MFITLIQKYGIKDYHYSGIRDVWRWLGISIRRRNFVFGGGCPLLCHRAAVHPLVERQAFLPVEAEGSIG
ncbi:hypothetical protein [Paenibacillus wynnii]|uniref:hypothetical protein n=1 Tax=Paenibacillus wynnii TaxID=268407 RepID=UPI00278E9403|nr:hypothetical protein [Paenibacillus wynnii]MDQ0193631.1 hypothetical protein [Paenibacillus wynnii]